MSTELTLQEVLDSKIYVKDTSGLVFRTPNEYISPFIDVVSKITTDFKVTVVDGSINQNEEGDFNRAYSRVLVEAKLPAAYSYEGETDRDSLDSKIGFIYALDLQKPVVKVFTGKDVRACTNLTIFNADHLYSQELTGNVAGLYKKAQGYIDTFNSDLEEFLQTMQILTSKTYTGKDLDELNGRMIRQTLKTPKLGTTPILQGIKELYEPKSIYALKDKTTTGWNYYNAITEQLKKADITDKALKTVILSSLILEETKN